MLILPGGLAQLARAPALHAGGQRFESVILHKKSSFKLIDMASGLKVQTLIIYTVIVTFAYLQIVTLIKFFDILENQKVVRRESIYRSH